MKKNEEKYIEGYLFRFRNEDDKDLDSGYLTKETEIEMVPSGTSIYFHTPNRSIEIGKESSQTKDAKGIKMKILLDDFFTEIVDPEGDGRFIKKKIDGQETLIALIEEDLVSVVPEGTFEINSDNEIVQAQLSGVSLKAIPSKPKSISVEDMDFDSEF